MNIEPVYKIVEVVENGKEVLHILAKNTTLWENDSFKGAFFGGFFGFVFAVILWILSTAKENYRDKKNLECLIKHELNFNFLCLDIYYKQDTLFNKLSMKECLEIFDAISTHCYDKLFDRFSSLNPEILKSIISIYQDIELFRKRVNEYKTSDIIERKLNEDMKEQELKLAIYNIHFQIVKFLESNKKFAI